MCWTEGTHKVWIVSIGFNQGCCVELWCFVDLVSVSVFSLLLLPHRREHAHLKNLVKELDQKQEEDQHFVISF